MRREEDPVEEVKETAPAAAPPPLRGSVDEPANGQTVRPGNVVVGGWHTWRGAPALAIAVEAEGRVVVAQTGTKPRPDVAVALGDPVLADSGWQVVLDLSRDEEGNLRGSEDVPAGSEVTLRLTVWGAPGDNPVSLDPLTVRLSGDAGRAGSASPTGSQGSLDAPDPGEPLDRTFVPISGWAMSGSAPARRVEVVVDGESVGFARLGLPRRDVHARFLTPGALIAGFDFLLDLTGLPSSASHVHVVVRAWESSLVSTVLADVHFELTPGEQVAAAICRLDDASVAKHPEPSRRPVLPVAAGASEPLSLVAFTHDLYYGGAELWLSELLRRTGAGSRFACTVVSPTAGPLLEELEAGGVNVHVTQDFPLDTRQSYEGRVGEIAAWLRDQGFNAALVNTVLPFAGVEASRLVGLPVVWAIHESTHPKALWPTLFSSRPDRALLLAYERLLGQAGALVFVADATRRLYGTTAGAERSVVIPYGIDTEAVMGYCERVSPAEARRSLGIPTDARVVLMVGATVPRKGQTMVAAAFAELAAEMPDVELVFLGAVPGDYVDVLREYLAASGLAGRSRVVDSVADTRPWYRAADLFVSGSDMESLPRSVFEAMCFGTPVLATRVFGLAELLSDGVTGYLFEPRDLGATEAALRRVLTRDETELDSVARAAQRLILESYDAAGYSAEVLGLLEGLRADPSAMPAAILARVSPRQGRSHD